MNTVEPKFHAILSASQADKWMNCPGWRRMTAGLPRRESETAREGTAAHHLAETCLSEDMDAYEGLGQEIEVSGKRYAITPDMAAAVQVYLDYVRQYTLSGKYQFCFEQVLDLTDFDSEMGGTADFVAWSDTEVVVVDYKHGRGVEVSADHPQFRLYALGCCTAQHLSVKTVVVQPRCPGDQGPVRERVWSPVELSDFGFQATRAAMASRNPDAQPCAGEWCRFCAAAGICPALREKAVAAIPVEFPPVGPTDIALASRIALPLPTSLSPEQKARVLEAGETIDGWIKAVRASVEDDLVRGVEIPGWKIVEGRRTRKWKGDAQAASALVPLLGTDCWNEELKSPSQIEKALKARGKTADLTPLVDESRKPSLVREDDKRPALHGSLLSGFDPIETTES